MLLVEKVLGNIADDPWNGRVSTSNVDAIHLDQWQGQKNRFKKVTQQGVEVAVSLDRKASLRDGDVLYWDAVKQSMIIVRLHLKPVMVIRIDESQIAGSLINTCVELGHALGNQHWPAVIKDNEIYVPLAVDQKVMSSVMKTHAIQGISYEFVPGDAIIAYLSPNEQRRLFGSPEEAVHSHTGAK